MKKRAYVVSEDIVILLKKWAVANGFIIPEISFFSRIREDFGIMMKKFFPEFVSISEDSILQGMNEFKKGISLLQVSLDGVYFDSRHHLELTRLVDSEKKDVGLGNRCGKSSIDIQIKNIAECGQGEVALFDDVIFTGSLIKEIIEKLKVYNVRVSVVCAGISIGDGLKSLREYGVEVRSVHYFDSVVDEVCERDFYPGVLLSGRTLYGSENVGLPYLLPFGDPVNWASIPEEKKYAFSEFCLNQTIKIFEEIELSSGRPVLCRDLERNIFSIPADGIRFVDALKQKL